MATNQNFFEKYGIKEVADVTFYRIEKKEETYESQRTISIASILKGAVELQTVYPMVDGVGSDSGFEAYVFTDADIITGANYDCDDNDTEVSVGEGGEDSTAFTSTITLKAEPLAAEIETDTDKANYIKTRLVALASGGEMDNVQSYALKDAATGAVVKKTDLKGLTDITVTSATYNNKVFTVAFTAADPDMATGANGVNSTTPDVAKFPGTHEYSYAEQVCMLFARRQNLITKTGTRYQFKNIDTLFGDIVFNDNFAIAPTSTEKVVVVGIAGRFTEGSYSVAEFNEAINSIKTTFTAKAYDVVYDDYAELVVEDEMGFFRPDFLGYKYTRNGGIAEMTPFGAGSEYATLMDPDKAILNAQMWGKGAHYSINDAIDALRQQQKKLDATSESALNGIDSIFGGYLVGEANKPNVGDTDLKTDNFYSYSANGTDTGKTSLYSLAKVSEVIEEVASTLATSGVNLKVTASGEKSNRAIYVKVGNVDLSASSYIYLLHNKNAGALATDEDGIFQFEDKKGNTLYYQDKIFAGTEWLALVIIGTQGMIFVVDRNGNTDVEQIAWMVNEGGYISNRQAASVVKNGLIHTTDITVNDETFEATCSVKSLKLRKIQKTTNKYVPVLFLDTLKVTTLEQTASDVYATGGHGNAQLIGWDFGKEITLSIEDALFSPASMSAIFGSYEGNDFRKGIKETKSIDNMQKCIAKRSFIVPAGNSKGTPSEADRTAQAVYYDPHTMNPYADGTPIAEGEIFYKWTRSIAYEGQSIGKTIEISADSFPGTYKVVGDTYARAQEGGSDERFQFSIPQAKMRSEQTITLEADGDPVVFSFSLQVLRPEDGVMVRFIQYDVVENEVENDGSFMVKNTENLNLLDDAELFKVSAEGADTFEAIGATEY